MPAQSFSLGEYHIHKILDAHSPVPLEMIFQDGDWSAFEENADWLSDQADMQMRMPYLSFHSYVLQTGRSNILVDACIGNHKDRGGAPIFHMKETPDYMNDLASLGLTVDDIDFVMCTHMHADHVGWNTQLIDGRWVPTFPNATYIFAEKEFAHWVANAKENPDEPWQVASYHDSILPVVDAGQSQLVQQDFELEKGIHLEAAPGHSPGNVVINVCSGNHMGIFSGDVVHHAVQMARPHWKINFCMDPELSGMTRRALVEKIADTETILMPAHFSGASAGRVRSHQDAFRFDFIDC